MPAHQQSTCWGSKIWFCLLCWETLSWECASTCLKIEDVGGESWPTERLELAAVEDGSKPWGSWGEQGVVHLMWQWRRSQHKSRKGERAIGTGKWALQKPPGKTYLLVGQHCISQSQRNECCSIKAHGALIKIPEDNSGLTGEFSLKGVTKKSLDVAWICRTKGDNVDNA